LSNNELKPINYIRLIKYFDNSLFNMIKDFIPARTNLKSGITIKPHLLERSKIVQPQVFFSSSIYSGSANTAFIEGGTGGTFNDYNSLTPRVNNTQSWVETIITPLGPTQSIHNDQSEFYNGELPYYPTVATDGELNPNNSYKYAAAPLEAFNPSWTIIYSYSTNTSLSDFINNINPSGNNIRVWVRRERTNATTGTPPVPIYSYTIEYIKIGINVGGVDYSNVLQGLQTITIPFNTGANFWYITVPVGVGAEDDGGNFYGYSTTPTPLPWTLETPNPFPANAPVTFFPNTLGQDPIIWDYYEYNPIINNTVTDVISTHYMDVDYGTGVLTPYNFDALISLSASKAAVQDSNYSSKAWSNIRYNGSRASSYNFNIPV
jgi:hypothetical protein